MRVPLLFWRRPEPAPKPDAMSPRAASEVWDTSLRFALPDVPLPSLLKSHPPRAEAEASVRSQIVSYGYRVGLADGAMTHAADQAFQSCVESALAAARSALATETAALDGEIRELEAERDDAQRKLEEMYAERGDTFSLALRGTRMVSEVPRWMIWLPIIVLWGFEFMLSFRVLPLVYGSAQSWPEWLTYWVAAFFICALTFVSHSVAKAFQGRFRVVVPLRGEKTLQLGGLLHFAVLALVVVLMSTVLLSITKFRVDATYLEKARTAYTQPGHSSIYSGEDQAPAQDDDIFGSIAPPADDPFSSGSEDDANAAQEPGPFDEVLAATDPAPQDTSATSREQLSGTLGGEDRRDAPFYFALFGASLVLVVISIPILLKKRADILRTDQYQRAFQNTQKRHLALTSIRASYEGYISVNANGDAHGSAPDGGARGSSLEDDARSPTLDDNATLAAPATALRSVVLNSDFATAQRKLLRGFYEQGKATGQRQRFEGMSKQEIEILLAYEAFAMRARGMAPNENGAGGLADDIEISVGGARETVRSSS